MPEKEIGGRTSSRRGLPSMGLAFVNLRAHLQTPLYSNAYALIVNTGATAGLGMLYWVLAARRYPPEAVGLNSAAISAMVLLAGMAQLNLGAVMVRFVPSMGRTTPRFVTSVYLVSLFLALVIGTIFILGINRWSPELGPFRANRAIALWFIAAVLSWLIFALQDSVLTGLGRATWIPVENTIFGITKIILLLAFTHIPDGLGIFMSWTIPVALSLVPVNFLIFRRLIPSHVRRAGQRTAGLARRDFVQYAVGDYLGALFALIPVTLLPILVANQAGAAANAYYYQSWLIAYSLQLIAINTTTSLVVEVARDPTKLREFTRRIAIHTVRLITIVAAAVVLLAPIALRAFGAAYAAEGTTLLRLLAVAAVPNIVVLLAVAVARVQRRISEVILIQGSSCLMILGLSSVLLPRLGINGVGLAWFVSQAALAAILLLTRLRWLRQ